MYLWPYDTLKELAEVEYNIYSAFIDQDKLLSNITKLKSFTKEVCKDDKELLSYLNDLVDMLNTPDAHIYMRIPQVAEVNPLDAKQLRTVPEKGEEV